MLVRGTHFSATLPADWKEDPSGDSAGGLRFLDPAYREITFSSLRFEPRGDLTIEWALSDLAQRKASIAKQNGAVWVSEPRAEHGTHLCVTHIGVASRDNVAVCLFEASVTHREPHAGGHIVVQYSCYEYWPPERSRKEGPPNADRAEAFARSVLETLRLAPEG